MQTTPALDLARRFVEAGAPPGKLGTMAATSGCLGQDIYGRSYFLATSDRNDPAPWLPLLSDRNWLGWVTKEVERRGYTRWSLTTGAGLVAWSVASQGRSVRGSVVGMEAALVAMLEATR